MTESIGAAGGVSTPKQMDGVWEEMLALESALASKMPMEELFSRFGLPWPPDPALHREPIGINEACADRS